ncbi:ADP-ribosyltransferase [Bacillus sp. IBL03825]|uniref:anthrax toxin lethal factor-related metalloendopeptidase n=1 Tax=Bacillus sp. IBL03825 TaxID=2953580 RepID=UPI002157B08C|nr:ADP-ribosyltransferase [Bacillus sp. IBL03825]MCR6850437.1 hypothetical protein [Bacillus sp. IBL03825]
MDKQILKKTFACIATVTLLGQFGVTFDTVYAAENNINSVNLRADKAVDFDKDKEKAMEWAENHSKTWKKTLNNEQKKLLNDTGRLEEMNKQLEIFDQGEISKQVEKDIVTMDKALDNKNAQLSKPLYVYKYLKCEDVGYKEGFFHQKDQKNKVDREKYQKLVNEFKYGSINTFMNADLIQGSTNQSTPILLSLKLPKGTKVGHLNEEHIIMERNLGIEIKKTSIIVEKGREVIKLEGEVVPKEKIQEKVKTVESNINQKFKEITGLNQDLLKLKIDNLYTSASLERAQTILKQLISNVPNNLLINIMKNMNTTLFTLTDKRLDSKNEDILGYYHTKEKTLKIQVNHLGHKEAEGNDTNTLLHEFGHAVDDLLIKGERPSISSEFINIYEKEKNNITIEPYIKTNSVEFFAGVFNYLHSPNLSDREQIQKEAPEACKFIQNLIKG